MKKVLTIALILAFTGMVACATARRGDVSYHGPSNERAEDVVHPSPGWSLAQGAIQQNPSAGVHFRSGSDEFDYFPDNSSSSNGQRTQTMPGRKYGGWFINKTKAPLTVQVMDSNQRPVSTFTVGQGQCYWVEMNQGGNFPWVATSAATGENASNMVTVPSPHAPVAAPECGKPGDFSFWVYDK
ncbi:MAG: hypothetical protein NTX82_03625 [Candidatus Parcubacteria bacterium]|nr:hypothetical protein [Candidatus Parcubacteria bacterium]